MIQWLGMVLTRPFYFSQLPKVLGGCVAEWIRSLNLCSGVSVQQRVGSSHGLDTCVPVGKTIDYNCFSPPGGKWVPLRGIVAEWIRSPRTRALVFLFSRMWVQIPGWVPVVTLMCPMARHLTICFSPPDGTWVPLRGVVAEWIRSQNSSSGVSVQQSVGSSPRLSSGRDRTLQNNCFSQPGRKWVPSRGVVAKPRRW